MNSEPFGLVIQLNSLILYCVMCCVVDGAEDSKMDKRVHMLPPRRATGHVHPELLYTVLHK